MFRSSKPRTVVQACSRCRTILAINGYAVTDAQDALARSLCERCLPASGSERATATERQNRSA